MVNVGTFYDQLEYFKAIWYNLLPLGIVCDHLLDFPNLVCLDQEKTGNLGTILTTCRKDCQIVFLIYQNKVRYTYQMATKCNKRSQNIPNGHRKYKRFFISRPSKIYPNLDFWFENIPSGNPAYRLTRCVCEEIAQIVAQFIFC
jgi:hypothetical protein